jgi:hypothetical protein
MERLWMTPVETESGRWTAAVPMFGGRGAKYGGQLVLTSNRVVWKPLHVRAPMVTHGVVLPIEAGDDWWEIPLGSIERVEADPERHALQHIVDRDETRTSFLVAAGRFGATWSKKNVVARDDAVERIRSAIGAQRS